MERIIRWFVNNSVASNLMMFFIILSGIATIPLLKMEVFPDIEVDIINALQSGDLSSLDAAALADNLGASLQEVADTITQAASVGVSTDLEAAAQGLGYGSFADAVAAYNQKYGTNYTVESAKEALGQ